MEGLPLVLPSTGLCGFGFFCTVCGGAEVEQGKIRPLPSLAVCSAVWLPA